MNPHRQASPVHGRAVLLFVTSASVLAYEILLMRLFSIALWHHFAYMVISVALLGFGAAGSFLFLFQARLRAGIEEWLVTLAGVLAVSLPLAFTLSREAGSDPLNLIWQNREWFRMFLLYLALALPFLVAGGMVGLILSTAGEKTHLLYGADLLGAGFGALAVVPSLYLAPPGDLIPVLGGMVLVAAIGCCRFMGRPLRGFLILLASAVLTLAVQKFLPPVPRMHETKALSMTLALPDARIEATRFGPLGMIHGVGSRLIREVPGLSLRFGLGPGDEAASLPEQKAIFVDGEGPSPVARFTGRPGELDYLDFTTLALPYHTRQPRKVLIVGGGGGSDVLLGLRHGAQEMVVLEANPQVVDLMKGPFGEFSGDLFRSPGVRVEEREARQFLHAGREAFDLIQLSLLDSFSSASGGLHSASESYLYTVEAFALYLSRLRESGVVAVTRWLKLPPRDSLRILATALSALRRAGFAENPEKHLLFIRSWKTSTILISRSPFSEEEIERAEAFCDGRSFDLAYHAGMRVERANRYDVQPSPVYYQGASALAGPGAEAFTKGYLFDVSPATDDRPYFSHFFRWGHGAALFLQFRREWLPMVDLGYLLILAALAQSLAAGTALILLPLLALRRAEHAGPQPATSAPLAHVPADLLYFGLIGAGFMFVEMALLPRFTLLLSHPIYSASAVLSTVLLSAGLGSLCMMRAGKNEGRRLGWPVGILCCWVGLHALLGNRIFEAALGQPLGCRVGLAVFLVAVPAFFLGWPFPAGLRLLSRRSPGLVPWAWGVNGCASVVGAVLGKALAMTLGLQAVLFMACGLYAAAFLVSRSVFPFPWRSDIEAG